MQNPPVEPQQHVPATVPSGGGCGCSLPGGAAPSNDVAVVGVRLRGRIRLTQFNSAGVDYEMGEHVVVEGDQGPEIGEVVQPTTRARRLCGIGCMKKVMRVAGAEDEQALERRAEIEREAADYCRVRIRERSLAMRLVRVEPVRETRKITFFFTSEGRVDFRELVKDLASRFHSRIEMRQIGVRDEARIRGGYGDCGRALCCSTFLKDFAPVSIRMAREQNLSLNPSKISGMCGRLKCCLRYEYVPPGGDPGLAPEDEPLPPRPPDPAGTPA
jgi:cell fate regulator YaaT (PSP1 superfamily)